MTLSMVGRLSECVLLAYRVPAASVRDLLPRGLELVTRGASAFVNVVACRVEKMRPAGTPRFCGLSYHHVAYRLYVRAETADGGVDGLFFLRSDADSRLISIGGNLASSFRFHVAPIELSSDATATTLVVGGAAAATLQARARNTPGLPSDSAFGSYEEAARVLRYRPLGLSVDSTGRRVRFAEVIRDEAEWRETPLSIAEARWSYLDRICGDAHALEIATRVRPLDYRWRLGRSAPLA